MNKKDYHNMLLSLSDYMRNKDESPICAKDLLKLDRHLDTTYKQLDMAMEMMRGVSHLWHGRGLSPQVLIEIDKTIAEIETIGKEVSNE